MTALFGGLHAAGWICRKHEKIEKVTASRDDGFVGGLGWICRKHEEFTVYLAAAN
jgi:hypothetical protein